MRRTRHRPLPACVALIAAAAIVVSSDLIGGQVDWVRHPTAGIPRLPDGRPNLRAPLPRTADGRPDISGLWLPAQPYVRNTENPNAPGVVPFHPWAEALFRTRLENFAREDPSARCVTAGVPRINAIPYPFRVIVVPGKVVILYEIYQVWREIFTDGRPLPTDPNPTWMGYSVGRWEGGDFVVHSAGFNGRAWLNDDGWPTSEVMKVTERFRRIDFGHMDLDMTIDDVKTYTRPFTIVVPLRFYADTELMEYACNENNKYQELLPR